MIGRTCNGVLVVLLSPFLCLSLMEHGLSFDWMCFLVACLTKLFRLS